LERDYLLKDLNEAQREAVSAPRGNMLIIAGAGTGKTKVLVSRIAWLANVEEVQPRNILAMTFTNKAAAEMRDRAAAIMSGTDIRGMWVSTFHSACLRIMRQHCARFGLEQGFTVLDADGQSQLVKRIEQQLNIDTKNVKPSKAASAISRLKGQGRRAADAAAMHPNYRDSESETFGEAVKKIYPLYEAACDRENIVDFAEIILRTVEVLRRDADLRGLLNRRFLEILVDEFQDTSPLQYELLTLLRGPEGHVWAVGDDDQSIYGWRGADYTNMKRFIEDFPDVSKVALTKNYRSGQYILDTANALIGENSERLVDKNLVSSSGEGERVSILRCPTPWYEASAVGGCIEELIGSGVNPSEIAVLYRNNSLSQAIEAELSSRGINYVVYGGLKFFERAEINDAVAYLRLAVNPRDDTALLRIINVPSRLIGPKIVGQLRGIASERRCSIYEAVSLAVEYGTQKGAPSTLRTLAGKAGKFLELMESLKTKMKNAGSLHEYVKTLVNDSGLMDYYKAKDLKEGRGQYDTQRHKNLEELINIAAQYEVAHPEVAEMTKDEAMLEFISSISLAASTELTSDGSDESQSGAVNLMTIHASKGLEFRDVFVIGVERGILPSPFAENRVHGMDEERRLAYVAITRAKKHLWMSFCRQRMVYGQSSIAGPSPFLQEIVQACGGMSRDKRPYVVEM
jgi:DNA helicase-2/ATP-dependent DNA helicase PcrA